MSATPTQAELETLAARLGACLAERGWRMATAESCTGGWIAQCVTAIAGSSNWFEAGLVTYSNAAKIALLGVDATIIERHGAVSEATAEAMARGALDCSLADLACAVTGVAGPGGGTPDKPVGLVCFGFATRARGVDTESCRFEGGRESVRAATVAHALDGLITRLEV